MTRRKILIGTAALALLPLGAFVPRPHPARAQDMPLFPDDRILGADDAPITMIEYSSLTCPHCAALHREALPRIKETWIADGKVRLVYRHFPLDGLALRAAAVANCLEGERFFKFLDVLFKSQKKWSSAKDPIKALGQLARLAGMSGEKVDACVNDEAEMNRILERYKHGRQTYGVASTPTVIVNGRKLEGARSFAEYESIFKSLMS
jgi:protein-disulfide isomerase